MHEKAQYASTLYPSRCGAYGSCGLDKAWVLEGARTLTKSSKLLSLLLRQSNMADNQSKGWLAHAYEC